MHDRDHIIRSSERAAQTHCAAAFVSKTPVNVPDLVGKLVGAALDEALSVGGFHIGDVVVINVDGTEFPKLPAGHGDRAVIVGNFRGDPICHNDDAGFFWVRGSDLMLKSDVRFIDEADGAIVIEATELCQGHAYRHETFPGVDLIYVGLNRAGAGYHVFTRDGGTDVLEFGPFITDVQGFGKAA